MSTTLDVIEQAIDSVNKLTRTLSRSQSQQVRAAPELINIKAIAAIWFKSQSPFLNHLAGAALLGPIDKIYNELLEYSEKSTSRAKYKLHLKALKAELVRLRAQVNILTTSGQVPVRQKPDFSELVSDKALLSILDRRWDETLYCIDGAPLAAVVMIGALLETLLLSRIEREMNKAPLFRLQCTPKDKTGKPKPLTQWKLDNYINACYELGWIRKPIKDVCIILRDYRNLIHPREELNQRIHLNSDDARMYWAIISNMADQIINSV